jgi:hypothetical protein
MEFAKQGASVPMVGGIERRLGSDHIPNGEEMATGGHNTQ